MKHRLRDISMTALPLVTGIAFIAIWWGVVEITSIPAYLIPSPENVVWRLIDDRNYLLYQASITLFETLAGFLISIIVSIPLAALIVRSRVVNQAIMPFLILTQTFPKVALAPLLLLWLGFGFGLKIAVSFLVAFFPIVIATIAGLNSVEDELLELARSSRASNTQTFLKIRLPWAMPQIFAGMKVAVAFSLVGAVVGEWVGADRGLGYVLIWASSNLDSELMFSVFVVLSIIGGGLYYILSFIEKISIPWHISVRGTVASATL